MVLENVAADGNFGELAWTLRRVDGLLVYDVRPTQCREHVNQGVERIAGLSLDLAKIGLGCISSVVDLLCHQLLAAHVPEQGKHLDGGQHRIELVRVRWLLSGLTVVAKPSTGIAETAFIPAGINSRSATWAKFRH